MYMQYNGDGSGFIEMHFARVYRHTNMFSKQEMFIWTNYHFE